MTSYPEADEIHWDTHCANNANCKECEDLVYCRTGDFAIPNLNRLIDDLEIVK